MINPASLAFDIDGVCADTMTLFLDIARDKYGIGGIKYEDITCYTLEECMDIDTGIVQEIIECLLDGTYTVPLKPIDGATKVLTRLEKVHSPILFVTARPYFGPIYDWLQNILTLQHSSIEVVSTGSFEGKTEVLLNNNISCFVEDRLETCFSLKKAGITPVVFKQPWNRESHPFLEVSNWSELESLINFDGLEHS